MYRSCYIPPIPSARCLRVRPIFLATSPGKVECKKRGKICHSPCSFSGTLVETFLSGALGEQFFRAGLTVNVDGTYATNVQRTLMKRSSSGAQAFTDVGLLENNSPLSRIVHRTAIGR